VPVGRLPRISPPSSAVFESGFGALGTTVRVLVTREADLSAAIGAVARTLAEVDRTYSRFRSDSELRRLAGGGTMTVTPLLSSAIAAALRAARETGGAVDPTVGSAMRILGYDGDFGALADTAAAPVLRVGAVPGWRVIRLNERARTVSVPAGVEIDLGSVGKAMAADMAAADALRAVRSGGVLISLGGDIATAGDAPDGGWHILATDDASDTSGEGEVVVIKGGAVATSGTTVRRWTQGGAERHHIIDPATGMPAVSPWRTVSVAASRCVDANAAATAAIVMGEDAVAWLAGHRLPARLVRHDGAIVRVAGWPSPAA
jgi:thiamine biosynthesis lipoprotein